MQTDMSDGTRQLEEDRKQMREARRLINLLSRTCRQTLVYLDGVSCMDKTRMRNNLRNAVRASDKFINS